MKLSPRMNANPDVLRLPVFSNTQLIVVGISLGGAFAARIARLHHPKLLILVAAFTSAPNLVCEMPLVKHLGRFCWYKLPTIEHVRELSATKLVLLHGERDHTIPPSHSEALAEAYPGEPALLLSPDAGHNNVFYLERRRLAEVVEKVLEES